MTKHFESFILAMHVSVQHVLLFVMEITNYRIFKEFSFYSFFPQQLELVKLITEESWSVCLINDLLI